MAISELPANSGGEWRRFLCPILTASNIAVRTAALTTHTYGDRIQRRFGWVCLPLPIYPVLERSEEINGMMANCQTPIHCSSQAQDLHANGKTLMHNWQPISSNVHDDLICGCSSVSNHFL